jgi:hypothetical protein
MKSVSQLIAAFRTEYISKGIDAGNLADNPIDSSRNGLMRPSGTKSAFPMLCIWQLQGRMENHQAG